MRTARISLLLALVLAALGNVFGAETNQILFLHVKLKDGVVTVVDTKVRPGVLKTLRDREEKRGLKIAVENAGNEALWTDVVEDPLRRRLEASDEASGALTRVPVEAGEAEFTVRTPVVEKMHHVSFYRERKVSAVEGGKSVEKLERKLLGKIPVQDAK